MPYFRLNKLQFKLNHGPWDFCPTLVFHYMCEIIYYVAHMKSAMRSLVLHGLNYNP